MIRRALFDTREEADRAATSGLERLVAWLTDRAREALPAEQRGGAGPSPVVGARLVSLEPLPVTATVAGADPHVLAVVELVDLDGRVDELTVRLRAAEVPPLPRSRGVLRVQPTKRSIARVRATVPDRVQITTFGPATIAIGDRLQDMATGKMFRVRSGASIAGAGKWPVDVAEVSSSEPGETTHGGPMTWLSPPINVMPQAAVLRMAAIWIPFGTMLVDHATDSQYMVMSSAITPSDEKLAGTSVLDIEVVRTDGPGAGAFTELEFNAAISGIGKTATLVSIVEVPVPKGRVLRNAATSSRYCTLSALVLRDDGAGFVPIEAVDDGAGSDLMGGEMLSFEAPVTGVETYAYVVEALPSETLPLALASAVVGAPLDFDAIVQHEPDGRWSTNVGTRPLGT